jgi:hypothetical protein
MQSILFVLFVVFFSSFIDGTVKAKRDALNFSLTSDTENNFQQIQSLPT